MSTSIRLENWAVIVQGDPYQAPELQKQRLAGKGHGEHPRLGKIEGEDMMTSSIVGQRAGCVVTSSGGVYSLGTVDPEYEKLYPNAKERLFATLPAA